MRGGEDLWIAVEMYGDMDIDADVVSRTDGMAREEE